ncbi:GrdB-related putative oxidoreductase [Enterococcus songbeiensis]|uniref:GrdB-related putative oxidoreductase n=1 Tax=Enterococcus songbeiensis TaxID=2559927 RepID=UPI0010F67257|nr:GrdB-related putative oxidoreductase [Enterococcus songbeiensis]
MKLLFILDQIQAGLGGKEQGGQPLGGQRIAIGSAKMFEKHLSDVDGEIIATLYSGDEFFLQDATNNSLKMAAMVKQLAPDAIICGPCFNYADYAKMAAITAETIQTKLTKPIPVVAAMSQECSDVIQSYKDKIDIIKMPKKGGTGLTDSLENILKLCQLKYQKADTGEFVQKYCY